MSQPEPQALAGYLMSTLEYEMGLTTNVFDAVPAARHDYKPDGVSKNALELVRHITIEDEWFLNAIADGKFADFADQSDACGIMSGADASARYKERMPAAIARVRALSADELTRELDFFGKMKMPAVEFLSLMLRHTVHHRGQLSTYLRPMGSKVPPIYGPSGDSGN
jgi:uncharacterized damage-inducible protein DinB